MSAEQYGTKLLEEVHEESLEEVSTEWTDCLPRLFPCVFRHTFLSSSTPSDVHLPTLEHPTVYIPLQSMSTQQ